MKLRLVDLLRCPVCRDCLAVHILSRRMEEVTVEISSPRCVRFCAAQDRMLDERGTPDSINCTACYRTDVHEGFLHCRACRALYPIVEGIPRLVRDAASQFADFFDRHRDVVAQIGGRGARAAGGRPDRSVFHRRSNQSFSLQWEKHRFEDRTWFKDDLDLRFREFLYSMDLPREALPGTLILDAGCGNGRLTGAVGRYGAEVVGMDLSRSVEQANENRSRSAGEFAMLVHFVQGNVMEPPFEPGAFDHVHTSGVLHHTPDPHRAFRTFLTLVRSGGRAYVQLYRRREAWVRTINGVLRFVTCRLPVRILYPLCSAIVPVHTALVLLVAWFRGEQSPIRSATRRERTLSLFDHLSPRYQFRYTAEQVRAMFERAGLRNIKDVTLANEARQLVAFVGDKA